MLTPERLKEIEESFLTANRAVRKKLEELGLEESSFDRGAQDFYQVVRETHWFQFSPKYQYEMLEFLNDPQSEFYRYIFANRETEKRIAEILRVMDRDERKFNIWISTEIFPPPEAPRFKKEEAIYKQSAACEWIERHAEDKSIILARIEEIFAQWTGRREAPKMILPSTNRTESAQAQIQAV